MIEVTNRDYQLRGVVNTEDIDKLDHWWSAAPPTARRSR